MILLVAVSSGRGGLYSPAEPVPFTIDAEGNAKELSFERESDGLFPQRFLELAALANPKDRTRMQIEERVRSRAQKELTPHDAIAQSADLYRLDRGVEAVDFLEPLRRTPGTDYRLLANDAHLLTAPGDRQDFEEAQTRFLSALREAPFPETIEGANPAQRQWLLDLEKNWYRRWLAEHARRQSSKGRPEEETIFPLFGPTSDQGLDRSKLPKDAVAVVQQLLLWAPWDTALYWLLAEIYASEGRHREAEIILNQCVEIRRYSNRKLLVTRRAIIRELSAKSPTAQVTTVTLPPITPKPDFLPSRVRALVAVAVFAFFAIIMLYFQLRRWFRP